jgi:hypothetical protein
MSRGIDSLTSHLSNKNIEITARTPYKGRMDVKYMAMDIYKIIRAVCGIYGAMIRIRIRRAITATRCIYNTCIIF